MKGINSTIVTAISGAIFATLGLLVVTGTAEGLVGGQSTADSTAEMRDLAVAINNTCKREGQKQSPIININLGDNEEITFDAQEYKVRLSSEDTSHESSVISACESVGIDFSRDVEEKSIRYTGPFYVVLEGEKIYVERGSPPGEEDSS